MIFLSLGFQSKYGEKNNGNIYEVLTQWRRDTLGNTFRNYKNTTMLVDKLCLQDKNIEEVIGILGKPNKVHFSKKNILNQIEYYTETGVTAKGEIIDTIDYCVASFILSEKNLNKAHFSYVCK